MTQEQKDLNLALAAALRSGKYDQGKGKLRKNTESGPRFCCLGVACDLVKDKVGGEWLNTGRFQNLEQPHVYDISASYAPEAVRKLYGWDKIDPRISTSFHDNDYASCQNDNGATFDQIAEGFERLALATE